MFSSCEHCTYPDDRAVSLRPPYTLDVIRWDGAHLYVNGYRSRLVQNTPDELALDVLGVVLDPVPPRLALLFSREVIQPLVGQTMAPFVMQSDAIQAWLRQGAA